MFLEGRRLVVGLKVGLAVRRQTDQAGFKGFVFCPRANITLHIPGFGLGRIRCCQSSVEPGLLQFLHHISQHCVLAQHGSGSEALPALRTAIDPQIVILVPVAFNAAFTITVSTWNSHRVLQDVQAYGTVELVVLQENPSLRHFKRILAVQPSGRTKPRQALFLQEVSHVT